MIVKSRSGSATEIGRTASAVISPIRRKAGTFVPMRPVREARHALQRGEWQRLPYLPRSGDG